MSVYSRNQSRMSRAPTQKLKLSAAQEEELREAFDLFDRDGDKSIGAKELHVVMQAIGRNMELQEVENHIRDIKKERRRETSAAGSDVAMSEEDLELDLDEFISFISKEMLDNDFQEELVEAYRKFGGNEQTGQGITREQLRATMENYGEKRLTDADFDLLFRETNISGNGQISFDEFVRMMMSK